MPEPAHVIAGRYTTVFEGTREQEQHGDMLVLVKPDSTRELLVDHHDVLLNRIVGVLYQQKELSSVGLLSQHKS